MEARILWIIVFVLTITLILAQRKYLAFLFKLNILNIKVKFNCVTVDMGTITGFFFLTLYVPQISAVILH